jgi:hypothetical protein
MSQTPSKPVMEFPCEIDVKAFAKADIEISVRVLEHVREHAPETPDHAVRENASSKGKYLSVSVRVQAESREQLDAIYRRLSNDPDILMAL